MRTILRSVRTTDMCFLFPLGISGGITNGKSGKTKRESLRFHILRRKSHPIRFAAASNTCIDGEMFDPKIVRIVLSQSRADGHWMNQFESG